MSLISSSAGQRNSRHGLRHKRCSGGGSRRHLYSAAPSVSVNRSSRGRALECCSQAGTATLRTFITCSPPANLGAADGQAAQR